MTNMRYGCNCPYLQKVYVYHSLLCLESRLLRFSLRSTNCQPLCTVSCILISAYILSACLGAFTQCLCLCKSPVSESRFSDPPIVSLRLGLELGSDALDEGWFVIHSFIVICLSVIHQSIHCHQYSHLISHHTPNHCNNFQE